MTAPTFTGFPHTGEVRRPTPRLAPVTARTWVERLPVPPRILAMALLFSGATVTLAFIPGSPAADVGPARSAAATSAVRVQPAADAYGLSGHLRTRLVMPSDEVEFPLEVSGDPMLLTYQWYRIADSSMVEAPRRLAGAMLRAPSLPGFYRLAIGTDSNRVVVPDMALAVMIPFQRKFGQFLNGYEIGWYQGERGGRAREAPEGFLEVQPADVNLLLSTHLSVADFLTHDRQRSWPKYIAVSPRLLDKLELVAERVARNQGLAGDMRFPLEVASGYRTPAHNRGVRWAARDSRHQYGDAADVAIDVNRDGRFTAYDTRAVMLAVELIEREYPDLAGGLGTYSGRRRSASPYVHIDARGRKARWRG